MQDTADGLHAISHPDEATGLLLTWIQQVGGRLTLPDPDDPDLLGIDLSLGAHQPLRAAAPRGSIPRSRLEDRLPFLLLEARQAIVSGSLDCTARVR
jgi:hypothetical protein